MGQRQAAGDAAHGCAADRAKALDQGDAVTQAGKTARAGADGPAADLIEAHVEAVQRGLEPRRQLAVAFPATAGQALVEEHAVIVGDDQRAAEGRIKCGMNHDAETSMG